MIDLPKNVILKILDNFLIKRSRFCSFVIGSIYVINGVIINVIIAGFPVCAKFTLHIVSLLNKLRESPIAGVYFDLWLNVRILAVSVVKSTTEQTKHL